jgi:uncharacterized protein
MRKYIAGLMKEPGARESFDFVMEDAPSDEEYRILDLPRVSGEVVNAGDHLSVSAVAVTRIEGVCARCLESVIRPMRVEFEDMFVRQGAVEEAFAESEFYVLTEDWLDLDSCAWEHILSALPMQLLCTEDCPGLCPRCGADLKKGPCGCQGRETDPRLAALARLKEFV